MTDDLGKLKLDRFYHEAKTLNKNNLEDPQLDESAIIDVYEKLYDQFVDVKRLTFSMAGLHRKPDAVAALISKEISTMEGVKNNAVWLLTGSDKMVETARNGLARPVDERRTMEWNSRSEIRELVLNQMVAWGKFHVEIRTLFPEFEDPIVFPIKGSAKALGFLVLEPGPNLDAERCQHITGFSSLILEMSHLYFRLEDEIKERKSLESLLIKERDRAQKYLDVAEVVLLALNREGKVELINRKGCQLLDYPLDEIVGKDWFECFLRREDRQFLRSVFADTLSNGSESTKYVESRLITRSGKEKLVAWRNTPVVDDAGNVTGSFSSGEDITELRQFEREKRQLQAHLFRAQKMEAIGTLVGGIAHDFNNMLQIIIGYSDLILMDVKESDPIHRDVQTIINTAKDGADLVRRLLLFGRESPPAMAPLDLNHQIKQLALILDHTLPKTARVEFDLTSQPVRIHGDSDQIDQALMNVLINASEAMPTGGVISVRTTNVALDEDYCKPLHSLTPGHFVKLVVSDSGKGMDASTLEKMFDPFFSTKQRGSTRGTGLGLSVVKGIIESHNGHVEVTSNPGKGTEFIIYLPAIELEAVTPGQTT